MILPICGFDAKNVVLCPRCESRVESGALTRADVDATFILAGLAGENPQIDGFSLERCRNVGGNRVIYLEKSDILAVRRSRTLYRAMQERFAGKIWLVESGADDKGFIADLFFPIKILSVNSVWSGGARRTKVVVAGRRTRRFPLDLDALRRIVLDIKGAEIDIVFEEGGA